MDVYICASVFCGVEVIRDQDEKQPQHRKHNRSQQTKKEWHNFPSFFTPCFDSSSLSASVSTSYQPSCVESLQTLVIPCEIS